MNDTKIDKVNKYSRELIMWQGIEINVLRQKEKIDWLRMGDENNKYFHAIIKMRHKVKTLNSLQKAYGTVVIQ